MTSRSIICPLVEEANVLTKQALGNNRINFKMRLLIDPLNDEAETPQHSATRETHVVFLYTGHRELRIVVRLHRLLVFFVPGTL